MGAGVDAAVEALPFDGEMGGDGEVEFFAAGKEFGAGGQVDGVAASYGLSHAGDGVAGGAINGKVDHQTGNLGTSFIGALKG
ncbi:hypothetical protein, partial [Snodgrassella communis]|uniref:hypothetical protein n=1 Tax=Snodgrassella communis TaxID=2946699 RepID=UPI001EF5A0C2